MDEFGCYYGDCHRATVVVLDLDEGAVGACVSGDTHQQCAHLVLPPDWDRDCPG